MIIPLDNKVKQEILVFQFTGDDSLLKSKGSAVNPEKYLDFRPTFNALENALGRQGYDLYDYGDIQIFPEVGRLNITWYGYKDNTGTGYIFELVYEYSNFTEDINTVHVTNEDGHSFTIDI